MLKNASNEHVVKLLLNVVLGLTWVLVLLVSCFNKETTQFFFTHISYYVVFSLVIVWAVVTAIFCRHWQIKAQFKPNMYIWPLLIAFLFSMVIFLSVNNDYRVLSDETNLLSVSKSMTFGKNVNNVTEGKWYYGMFWSSAESVTEKRPFLFPFTVSILHNLLGYDPHNAFILNFVVLWGILFLMYLIVQPVIGAVWAYAAMILLLSHPLICLSAASASFELFNLFFIFLSFVSLRHYLKSPDHLSLIFLAMNLVMLANVRYESVLFLLVVFVVLSAAGYLRVKMLGESCIWGLMPFFFLSLIWQRIILLGVSDSNLQGGSWVKAFQFSNLNHNFHLFFKYVLDLSGHLGYAGILTWAGLLGMAYYLCKCILFRERYISREKIVLFSVSVLSLGGLLLLMLFYQGHIADHPMNGRLYIPILVALAIVPIFVFADILKKTQEMAIGGLICCAAVFFYYHPVAVEDRLSNQLFVVRDFKFIADYLQKNADKNDLIICGRPGQFIIYNYGAISFSTANKKKKEILSQYKNRLFNKIYVIQEIEYKTKAPEKTNVVVPEYQLRTVKEVQGGTGYTLRISEVLLPTE